MTALYAITSFVSAALLFLVQPMVGKMLLPLLGGTPAVWSTCMVFFQGALLLGYGYAYLGARVLGARRHAPLHLMLLVLPLLVLPIAVDTTLPEGAERRPVLTLLGLLLHSAGPPFLVLAASAPLLQAWFSNTGHPHARDPYFLYAASNLGSVLALLSYPLLFEPLLPLRAQSRVWAAGYGALVLLFGACARCLWRARAASPESADGAERPSTPAAPRPRDLLSFVLLGLCPSSLLLGVTTHISTNIAALPLLWVVPLLLYLLSFILVFSRRPLFPYHRIARLLPLVSVPLMFLIFIDLKAPPLLEMTAHLLVFFMAALACHDALCRSRPGAAHLTVFYLLMSLGGVLGGAFNALVAPLIFPTVIEYPLMLLMTCLLLLPPLHQMDRLSRLCVVICAASVVGGTFGGTFGERRVVHRVRGFFGVLTVKDERDKGMRRLVHGTTLHGTQRIGPDNVPLARPEPLAYYHRSGPVGQVFETLAPALAGREVAIIGMGVGALCAYARPGQRFTFYEIDPRVVEVARDARLFTFLRECAADVRVVIGDGRLRLAEAPAGSLALLVVDAFSSDAIPVHLITREAVKLYMSRLAEDGVLLMHLSNHYLDLVQVIASITRAARIPARLNDDRGDGTLARAASTWVALAGSEEILRKLPGWSVLPPAPGVAPWRDDFSNIITLLK